MWQIYAMEARDLARERQREADALRLARAAATLLLEEQQHHGLEETAPGRARWGPAPDAAVDPLAQTELGSGPDPRSDRASGRAVGAEHRRSIGARVARIGRRLVVGALRRIGTGAGSLADAACAAAIRLERGAA